MGLGSQVAEALHVVLCNHMLGISDLQPSLFLLFHSELVSFFD